MPSENVQMVMVIGGGLLIVAILLAVALLYFPPGTTTTPTTTTPGITDGVGTGTTDLRTLFQPIIVAHGDAITACIGAGGVWHYEPNYVGCVATRGPIIDCSNPLFQTAMLQCSSLENTEAVCDPNNAYCKYIGG